jgi:hypothetical protein
MENYAFASQLAQSRPAGTTIAAVYTAARPTEITQIVVCNTTASPATFQLCHDDNGTTYDETTALYWNVSVPAASTTTITANTLGEGISIDGGGSVAFRTSVVSALTISIYGVLQQGRGRA